MFRLKLIQVAKVAKVATFFGLLKKKITHAQIIPTCSRHDLGNCRESTKIPHFVCSVRCAVKSDGKSQKFHDRETIEYW